MALQVKDRICESNTSVPGTGAITLANTPITSCKSIVSTFSNGDTCYYVIQAVDSNGNPTGNWEAGLGTYTTSGTSFARTTPSAGSASTPVNFTDAIIQIEVSANAAYLATLLVNGGALGTPSSGTLSSCSGLPISGIASLGTGVGTALAAAVTGSSSIVLSTSPSITTPTNTGNIETSSALTNSSGTVTINCALGNCFTLTLAANITTMTMANVPASGNFYAFALQFTANGTGYTVAYMTGNKWGSGTAPTLTTTSGKKDTFIFYTVDGGSSWGASIFSQNM